MEGKENKANGINMVLVVIVVILLGIVGYCAYRLGDSGRYVINLDFFLECDRIIEYKSF